MCVCVCVCVTYQQPDLAESMAELSRLGSLLGLPSILDPMFPVAYTAFFGSLPPTTPAEGTEGQPTSSIDTSNVCVCVCVCVFLFT